MKQYMKPKEMCELLDISRSTLDRRVKRRQIDFIRIGACVRFPVSIVQKLKAEAAENGRHRV